MPAFIIAGSLLFTLNANSQERKLPDGSVVYSDGTRRFPNGTVIYKGNNGNVGTYPGNTGKRGTVVLPDGRVIYPDGSRRYPNEDRRYEDGNNRRHNRNWLPPGQAKKIYGGSAKDYAHDQQKKWNNKRKHHDDDDHDDDHDH